MGITMQMTDEDTATPATSETSVGDTSTDAGESKDAGNTETGQGAETESKAGDDSAETGGNSAEAADKEAEKAGEKEPPATDATKKEPESDKTQDEIRRYQADRDRAEQQLKNFYKEILPHVEVDDFGRVIGPRKKAEVAPENAEPQYDINALTEASANGDQEATKTLLWIAKEQAKREAKDELRGEMRNANSFESDRQGLKKEFPDLYVKDDSGRPSDKSDESSPLFKETLKVFQERSYLNMRSPRDVRTAAIEAENRLLKAGLPEFEKKLKTEVQTKMKKAGASSVGVSTGGSQATDDLKGALTDSQVNRLKKEGQDDEGIKRISRIVKQAKKEGGFYL